MKLINFKEGRLKMARRLEELMDIVRATSDQDVDDFVDLMKPDSFSRAEMQQVYEETLGYDPTSYFDKKDIGNISDRIATYPDTPQEAVDYINDSKEELVDTAYDIFDDGRQEFLQAAVEQAIEEATGVAVDADVIEDEDDDDGRDSFDEDEEENEDDEESSGDNDFYDD
jgi:hypothetical protein